MSCEIPELASLYVLFHQEGLTDCHALVCSKGRGSVVHSPRVPENKVTRIHAGLHPLAATVLEPLELLICPVEKVSFVPTTLGLHLSISPYQCLISDSQLTASCSLKYCSNRGAVPVMTARPPSSGPLGSWYDALADLGRGVPRRDQRSPRVAYQVQQALDTVRPRSVSALI